MMIHSYIQLHILQKINIKFLNKLEKLTVITNFFYNNLKNNKINLKKNIKKE
jgi:hypothetical protein